MTLYDQLWLLECFGRECKRLMEGRSELVANHWKSRLEETRNNYGKLKRRIRDAENKSK